ncbi:hypothetical protein PTI98_009282 [Pleurotus ostreatus]|nr:hypothetical protein PTI98_009282 [Pleurotus ostreatus]
MASPNDHKRIFITDKGAEEWPYGEEIVVTHLRVRSFLPPPNHQATCHFVSHCLIVAILLLPSRRQNHQQPIDNRCPTLLTAPATSRPPLNLARYAYTDLRLVKQFSSVRQTSYHLVVQMLNHASSLIWNRYARENKLIVFRDNHSYTPKYHVNRIETGEPDIVATLAPINDLLEEDDEARLPWHHILSVIEEKGKLDKNKGPRQSGAYLAFATQCRPDLVGMYGMSISPVGYVLQYSCASGLQTSGEFPWADIGPLVSYVYTLYVPHPGFASRDPSVTLADNGDTLGSPSWNIRDGDKVYENCVVKVVGDPWHRMTWVARVGNTPITIKDSYRDAHGSFKEGELYDILHKQGPAPGFLRVKKEYEVEWKKSCPIRVTVDTSTRIKTRLIMHTWGESLRKCPSLIDFLKCMYDILEGESHIY